MNLYVLAAAVVVVGGLFLYGQVQKGRADAAQAAFSAYRADAERQAAELRAKAAEVKERVVIQYRDRVKQIRVPTPVEVVREIEIIRESGCTLPAEFRVLHDSAAGDGDQAAGGADGPAQEVDCATAIETIRENYARSRENAAQLEALQEWARAVSAP